MGTENEIETENATEIGIETETEKGEKEAPHSQAGKASGRNQIAPTHTSTSGRAVQKAKPVRGGARG